MEILFCKLCNKHYKDPRILPCYHTFCLSCLRAHFFDKKGKSRSKSSCPICNLNYDKSVEVESLKRNDYISKWISLNPGIDHSKGPKYAHQKEDIPCFVNDMLVELKQETDWSLKHLHEIDECIQILNKNLVKVKREIKESACKLENKKNEKELLDKINMAIKGEEDAFEVVRTKLIIYFLGLEYHQRKLTECSKDYGSDDISIMLSDCKCFLDSSTDLKYINKNENLKKFEFVKYPDPSYVLGQIGCICDEDNFVACIDQSGTSRIVSISKFEKKLRTAAYCRKRNELFLIFPSCKDILVISVNSTVIQRVTPFPEKDCCEANMQLVFSDGYKGNRKIFAGDLEDANDAVACSDFLFVSERSTSCLHKIPIANDNGSKNTRWDTGSYNNGLSATPLETLLVACNSKQCLIEYNTDGSKIRTIDLRFLVANPRHALFLPREFISQMHDTKFQTQTREACHYFALCLAGINHDIVIISSEGEVLCKYSNSLDKLNYPVNLTLIKNNSQPSFLVCDKFNRRFLVIGQNLTVGQNLSLVFGDALNHRNNQNDFGIQYSQTFYNTSCSNTGKIYKIKFPGKSFLTEQGVVFIVDEDNNSLLRLEGHPI